MLNSKTQNRWGTAAVQVSLAAALLAVPALPVLADDG